MHKPDTSGTLSAMWGVVVGVIIAGFIIAAIMGALREKQPAKTEAASFWGTPKQAGVLIAFLAVLAVVVVWAIQVNNASP